MASYEHLTRRLQRLEGKRVASAPPGSSHAEDMARWRRLLQEHNWSEPAQHLIGHLIAWHEQELAQGHPQGRISPWEAQQVRERFDARIKQMLGRFSDADLSALRGTLEQEVAQDV